MSFFSAFYVELFTKRLLKVLVRNLNQGAILLSLRTVIQESWDYRCVSPWQVLCGIESRSLCFV